MKYLIAVKALVWIALASKFSCCAYASNPLTAEVSKDVSEMSLDELLTERQTNVEDIQQIDSWLKIRHDEVTLVNFLNELTKPPLYNFTPGRAYTNPENAVIAKKNAALNNISKALGVKSDEKPMYLITVTRAYRPIGAEDFLFHAAARPNEENAYSAIYDLLKSGGDIDYEKKFVKGAQIAYDLGTVLKILCSNDEEVIAEISQRPEFQAIKEMNGCAKLVLFNEFFFGRDYEDAGGQEGEWRSEYVLLPYLNKCPNTIFYTHDIGAIGGVTPEMQQRSASIANTYRCHPEGSINHPTYQHNNAGFKNFSHSFYNNTFLTEYEKSSYCRELQTTDQAVYIFGDGIDKPADTNINDTARVLLDNVCTEICYDLYCGIRKQNNWSNAAKKDKPAGLLLIQSGSSTSIIPQYCDNSDHKCALFTIHNLPISTDNNIIYILHADSHIGGSLATIHQNGAQIEYDPYMTFKLRNSNIKITVYKVEK